jgi:archaellum component FlaC
MINDPLKAHREAMEQISNPMKFIRESMDLINDPLKAHREAMEQISDPMKFIRESMALINDPLKAHREAMEQISDPMKFIRESMGLINDPLKAHREAMEQISDPMKFIRESMGLINDPLKAHREALAQIEDPMKDLRTSMLSVNPLKPFTDSISVFKFIKRNASKLNTLKQIVHDVNLDIEFDEFGKISLSNEVITTVQLQRFSDDIVSTMSKGSESVENAIKSLISEVEKSNSSSIHKLFIAYIYPIIIMLLSAAFVPISDYYIKNKLGSDKRSMTKDLKINAKNSVSDLSILNALRYVSADMLNVRKGPSKKSEFIGILNFSYTVLLIEKNNNWSLIEWRSSDGNSQIKGWVYSRYLKKFR